MSALYIASRHIAAGALASVLIASGAPRRARARLTESKSITSLYFHNPRHMLFARCVSWLRDHGYTFISAADLIQVLQGERPYPHQAVWLSLDDGYKEWMDEVLPVARQYRIPVTLFIPTGIVEGDGLFPWLHDPAYPDCHPSARAPFVTSARAREALTLDQLRHIANYPEVTIGGHTVDHLIVSRCTAAQLRQQIFDCKSRLESITGRAIETFGYPAGQYDSRALKCLAECGFRIAATTQPAFITSNTDCLLVPRVCIPDGVTFAEAICRMLGIWQPCLAPLKAVLHCEDR